MGPLRDCECGMAKILHNVKQCSTCEVADRMADEIATLTRERDEALAEVEKLLAAQAGEGEAPSCAWTMDEDGVWHTGCGASWIYFPGGTPDEHGQRFCHACGKSIAAAGLDDEGRPSP